MDRLLTVNEVAEDILHCHPQTIYRNKEIPRIEIPGIGIRFKESTLLQYLEKCTKKVPSIYSQLIDNERNNLTLPPVNTNIITGGISEMPKGKNKTRFNFGYGAIYQRKTKKGTIRWYLDYRDANGKRLQPVAKLASTKEEAALELRKAVADVIASRHGIQPDKQNTSFKEYANLFLMDYLKVERRNCNSDIYRLNYLMDHFGDVPLKGITSAMVRRLKRTRKEVGNSDRTVNRYLALLKRLFNVAITDGYTDSNPVRDVKFFSENSTKRDRVLSDEEETRLLHACPTHLRPFILTALHTGMRKGELLKLRWNDVDFSRREIKAEQTKSSKVRFIPINSSLLRILEDLRGRVTGSDLVFPFKSIRTAFENALKRAAITGLTFHDLRRTFGTRLLERGVDIVTIQKLYGHSNPLVTQRYLHPDDEIKKEAVELLTNSSKSPQKQRDLLRPCDTDQTTDPNADVIPSLSVN